jgi:two-component sensor histidine kinase
LLKEIDHRVKNNLQVISSLLNLQSEYLPDRRGKEMFTESQHRVKSMALIHEKLYLSEDLGRLDFADYIQALATSLFQSYRISPQVALSVNVEDVSLGIDQAIPCGLIINELVSNSLKHAFADGGGELRIDLRQREQSISLEISDDGAGLPSDVDVQDSKSLGLKLVNILVGQLKGSMQVHRESGTQFKIEFEWRPVAGQSLA